MLHFYADLGPPEVKKCPNNQNWKSVSQFSLIQKDPAPSTLNTEREGDRFKQIGLACFTLMRIWGRLRWKNAQTTKIERVSVAFMSRNSHFEKSKSSPKKQKKGWVLRNNNWSGVTFMRIEEAGKVLIA